MLKTIALLILSNIFMTFAWYGHLKQTNVGPLESDPRQLGNRFFRILPHGSRQQGRFLNGFNGFQLKITQEIITLVVFAVFAVLYLKEPFQTKYLISFAFILGAVYFAFKK
jgi:uncharacterized protein (DUF486 family)